VYNNQHQQKQQEQQQQQQQRRPSTEANELALILLVHENLKRRTGKQCGLLPPDGADLLNARATVAALDCAVALFGAPLLSDAAAAPLLYANEAARGALAPWLPSSDEDDGDHALLSLPPPAAAAAAAAAAAGVQEANAKCVEASGVVWRPGGSSGSGSSGGREDAGPLEVDTLLVCPVTSPNGGQEHRLLQQKQMRCSLCC
jgi:hypothetical protein